MFFERKRNTNVTISDEELSSILTVANKGATHDVTMLARPVVIKVEKEEKPVFETKATRIAKAKITFEQKDM